jgi:23S rRNA (cytosine1962-C5)-methyltransferase
VDGDPDGLPGVTIDAFAGHWLVTTQRGELPEGLEEACAGKCRSLWWKVRETEAKLSRAQLVLGDGPQGAFLARECGLRFWVDFHAGAAPGIFLDQRLNRSAVRERASEGDRVLNCFAYTCAFSASAALSGARTTSVDLSARYLEWGKRNLVANEIDPGKHFFCRGDVASWLERFQKQGRRFSGVILDPPTFSHGSKRGRDFRLERDYGDLLEAALGVVEADGWMLCCANHRGLTLQAFLRILQRACAAARLEPGFGIGKMPPEYRDRPYLKSVWIELGKKR